MAEVSVEQVLMRGGAIWAIAMAAHLAASFVASRFRSGDAGGFLVVMVLTLSHALILLGASTSAAYATAWMIRNYANTLHYEIFFAICAAAGIAGI